MAEQRLIDAEALYKKVLGRPVTNVDGHGYINHNRVLEMIDNEPTVDAKPVVHAHWIRYPDCGVTKCSNCGWNIEECWDSKWCPECGAQMDEEINNG